jgi:uncharacterized membrane protein
LLLAAGTYARARDEAPALSAAVYLAGSRICHQQPGRTFHTHGTPWPVCGRCAGLYLGAPFGALAAWRPRRRRTDARPSLGWLIAAGLPTAVTFAVEHGGLVPGTTALRFVAALPLGAAVSWVIVRVAADSSPRIG